MSLSVSLHLSSTLFPLSNPSLSLSIRSIFTKDRKLDWSTYDVRAEDDVFDLESEGECEHIAYLFVCLSVCMHVNLSICLPVFVHKLIHKYTCYTCTLMLTLIDGQFRLKGLIESVDGEHRKQYPELVSFICSACLRFRNGDMETAAERVSNYLVWRINNL